MITIDSAEIRDFRSHSHTKIKFSEKVNFIVGPNGSGKSTIIESIACCLMGRTSMWSSRAVNLESLIRDGQDQMDLTIYTTRGTSRFMFTSGGKTIKEGDLDFKYSPSRMKLLFNPTIFFDASSTERQKMVAEFVGFDESKVHRDVSKKLTNLGLLKDYHPKSFSCSYEGLKAGITKVKSDRKTAKDKADKFEAYARQTGSGMNIQKLIEMRINYESWYENCATLRNLIETTSSTGEFSLEEWAKVNDAIDAAALKHALMKNYRLYTGHGQCPLGMHCKNPETDWKKIEVKAPQEEMEAEQELSDLRKRRLEMDQKRSMQANLNVWRTTLAELEARSEEMASLKEEFEDLIVLVDDEVSMGEKKEIYLHYRDMAEKLDELAKFLEHEILKKYAKVDVFNNMLSVSPYDIKYVDGNILWNGRQYEYCSPSQQFRCRLALAEAVGQEVGFIVIDGFEILDAAGKAENFKVLQKLAKEGFQSFVVGTYTQPFEKGTCPVKCFAGAKMIWCENNGDGGTKITEVDK